MDFKSLREQILANIDEYNPQDMKVVITKLLDFLIDNNEKRSKLENENKQLFEEVNKINQPVNDYKGKLDEIIIKANNEAKRIVENALSEKENILSESQFNSQNMIEEAESKGQEIIATSVKKIESIISDMKKIDDDTKLFRSHILSIFRKTIFRFAESNYYIIRSDNKDFQELLRFFEIDEKLQKLCDENIAKIENNEDYQKLVQQVKENPEIDNIHGITNILTEKQIMIDNERIDVEEVIKKTETIIEEEKEEELIPSIIEDVIIDEEEEKEIETPVEEEEEEIAPNKQTFIEIMNKYKKK